MHKENSFDLSDAYKMMNVEIKPTPILELISFIKRRPELYLGRRSISCLKAYLDGWCSRGNEPNPDYEVMSKFQDWVATKYRIITTHSWCNIILFFSFGDEHCALDNFFKDFDEFLFDSEKTLLT